MGRIHACSVPAEVIQNKPCWHWANGLLVSEAVREHGSRRRNLEPSVALRIQTCLPWPTFIWPATIHLCPKPSNEFALRSDHHAARSRAGESSTRPSTSPKR